MARLKVLDTNAMIAVSQGKLDAASQDIRVVISFITRIELLAWPELTGEERNQVRAMPAGRETEERSANRRHQAVC